MGAAGYQQPNDINVAVGYRWQYSDRHFTGEHEEPERQEEGSEVINDLHLIDLSVTYAINSRVSLSLLVPFQSATRSQTLRDDDDNIILRYETAASGLGDIRLLGTTWLLKPERNENQNISLGLGIDFPTGEKAVKDIFPSFDGGVITAEQRNVDQSIQPGDGGWGVILDVSAFKRIKRTTAFFSGTYVITPEEKSGVRTFRSRPSEAIMSIADQYLARLGAAYDLFPEWGVSTLLALRAEGVPVRDLFGGSRGFRRPGVAVSIEPGLVFSKEGWTASLSTPVAIYRNRQRSVPDEEETERTGDFRHGDAAFADFMVLFTLGKRF